jgi:hypothetical protein
MTAARLCGCSPTGRAAPTPRRGNPKDCAMPGDRKQRRKPNRISSSGHDRPDQFNLDRRPWPVAPEPRWTAVNCNPNCNPDHSSGRSRVTAIRREPRGQPDHCVTFTHKPACLIIPTAEDLSACYLLILESEVPAGGIRG